MLKIIFVFVRALALACRGHRELVLENLALRLCFAKTRTGRVIVYHGTGLHREDRPPRAGVWQRFTIGQRDGSPGRATVVSGLEVDADANNPDFWQAARSTARSRATALVGSEWVKQMGCGPTTANFASQVVAYLDRTSARTGPTGRFVRGCVQHYKGQRTEQQCQYMADVGRAVIPELHQAQFSADIYRTIASQSSSVGIQIGLQCRITN